jgi:hypothetical protein
MLQPSDRKYDRHQAPDLPGKNQPIGASTLKRIVDMVLDLVREGRGIEVRRVGQHVYIHNKIVPTAGASSGGSTAPMAKGRFKCPTVETLPAVPTASETFQMVYWTSAGGGTGDNQVWWTRTDLTRWYPLTYGTLNGTPGAEELV